MSHYQTSLNDLELDEGASKFSSPKFVDLGKLVDLLVFRPIVDAHADLFLAGEAQPQGATAAVG